MKKILSIFLAAVIAFSVFGINATAEGSQAEKFFADLDETMSLGVKYESVMNLGSGVYLNSADRKMKIYENSDGTYDHKTKFSGDLIFYGFYYASPEFELLMTDDEVWGYLPEYRMKLNFGKLLNVEADTSYDVNESSEVNNILFNPIFKCFEYVSSREGTLDGHGEIEIETLKVSPYKLLEAAIEKGTVNVPEGTVVSALSIDEVYSYLATAEWTNTEDIIEDINNITYDVYIEDGKVYDIIINVIDDEGNPVSSSINYALFNVYAEYIYTNIGDDELDKPIFYMDWTWIVKWILSMILV